MTSSEPEQQEIIQALYLDRDGDSFKFFSDLLKEWFGEFIHFQHVENLEEGLERINSGEYDIIFSEIIFDDSKENPRGTILKLTEQPGAADTPMVIITDCDDAAMHINAYRNGVMEYFAKKDLNRALMEYRLRNLLQREFRTKIIYQQFNESMQRFQQARGMSRTEIEDLNSLVNMMKAELETEYNDKMTLEAERNKIQSLFGMYVDPAIVRGIMNNEISVETGRKVEIAVLFTDIRGYTSLTEKMQPEDVLSFLNEYFTSMTEVLMGYEGMVDKYIGDSIMCLFGSPLWKPEYRDNALYSAMEMQGIFEVWQATWTKTYGITPHMGVGVASGEAVVGNVGSFQKISYTAIGDTVNVAARLEQLAGPGEVLISEQMYLNISEEARNKYTFDAMEPIAIKGKTGMHQVYRVT